MASDLLSQNGPTAMSNAQATMLGLKAYTSAGTYNGGGAPTLTGTNLNTSTSASCAVIIPYQMQDGNWRAKIHIRADYSVSASSFTNLVVSGVLFSVSAPYFEQTLSTRQTTDNNTMSVGAYLGNGSGIITAYFSGSIGRFIVEGDVALVSKPTWAY